jgi:pimeloyl-ACP methyl ester carboxylesterase
MLIEVDGHQTAVEREGRGPPLVLLHSLLTDMHAFGLVLPDLVRRNTVIRIALPGFSGSAPMIANGPGPAIDDLADRLASVMIALDCGPETTVMGNGLGAFASVALAIRHGAQFRGLIVANGGAAFSGDRSTAFDTMSGLVEQGGMGRVVDTAVQRIFPPEYLTAHPEVVEQRRAALEQIDPQAFADWCRALAKMDLRADLGRIDNPTLVIAGERDETTPVEMSEDLAGGIPGATLTVISGCGHCPQLQRPAELVEAVAAFLGTH